MIGREGSPKWMMCASSALPSEQVLFIPCATFRDQIQVAATGRPGLADQLARAAYLPLSPERPIILVPSSVRALAKGFYIWSLNP